MLTACFFLGTDSPPVLRALRRAASILYGNHQSNAYPELKNALLETPSAAAAAAAVPGAEASTPVDSVEDGQQQQQGEEGQEQSSTQEEQQQQQKRQALPEVVAMGLHEGATAAKPELESAKKVAEAVRELLKGSIKRDIILVLPIVPSAAVRLDAESAVQHSFLERVHQFAAVSSLAGLPSVIVPVGQVKDGSPLCVAFCAQQRNDKRLLAVAAKLLPFIQIEREKILLAQEEAEVAAAEAARAATGGAGGRMKGSSSRRGGRTSTHHTTSSSSSSSRAKHPGQSRGGPRQQQEQRQQQQQAAAAAPADPKKVERAEKFKAKGNEFFKAGRYVDAVKQYSEAVRVHPDNPVYYSNRAMAYLKTFM